MAALEDKETGGSSNSKSILTQQLCHGENSMAEDNDYVNQINIDLGTSNQLVWQVDVPGLLNMTADHFSHMMSSAS